MCCKATICMIAFRDAMCRIRLIKHKKLLAELSDSHYKWGQRQWQDLNQNDKNIKNVALLNTGKDKNRFGLLMMVITINYWTSSHHHISALPHPSGRWWEHLALSANVQLEFSSATLHIALQLNSHLQVQHVNITYSFYLTPDELSGCVVFSLPIGLYLSAKCTSGLDASSVIAHISSPLL